MKLYIRAPLHAVLDGAPHDGTSEILHLSPQMHNDVLLVLQQAACSKTLDDLAFGTNLRCISQSDEIYYLDVPFFPKTNAKLSLSLRVISETTWEIDLAPP